MYSPLLLLIQTCNVAATICSANSAVTQELFPISRTDDNVSRTRDKVSSVVANKNGPRSLVILNANGTRMESSIPVAKLDRLKLVRSIHREKTRHIITFELL